ncbi:leucine-rich repeat family protein [Hibiscus syriacus]|uniref:Leucine-rich repeat family protein n=1 Tax=Hibiscus syriacus TaxID=106335 RepID=A0A6A2XU11_HIBSY|nr:uncharacterized protein LOC120175194 [Hibiscus syriacus]KAE8670315.1 leucine-rich repeat family protein [Hibiscus syriacus]
MQREAEKEKDKARVADFEFLSSKGSSHAMLMADELFFEGKLLPFWQIQHSEKLKQISLRKTEDEEEEEDDDDEVVKVEEVINKDERRSSSMSWFVDDDPSPRPPKCTVLWKELLRLKKQRASSLSSPSSSLADIAAAEEGKQESRNRDNKHVKRIKKGLERTRSASIRIRPMINVPICTQVKSSALSPLFPLKKGR